MSIIYCEKLEGLKYRSIEMWNYWIKICKIRADKLYYYNNTSYITILFWIWQEARENTIQGQKLFAGIQHLQQKSIFKNIQHKNLIPTQLTGSLQILVTSFLVVFPSFWLHDFLYFKFLFCLSCLTQWIKYINYNLIFW